MHISSSTLTCWRFHLLFCAVVCVVVLFLMARLRGGQARACHTPPTNDSRRRHHHWQLKLSRPVVLPLAFALAFRFRHLAPFVMRVRGLSKPFSLPVPPSGTSPYFTHHWYTFASTPSTTTTTTTATRSCTTASPRYNSS